MSRPTLRAPSASTRVLGGPRLAVAMLVAALSFLCLPAAAGATLFSNATQINMPLSPGTATPYPSPIAVSSVVGPLLNVRATLVSMTTEDVGNSASEIDALLVAPNGQNVVLMSGVCGVVSDVTLTFDDTAGAAIDSPCATGSYKPFDAAPTPNFPGPAPAGPYGSTLGPLGSGPNGTWNLFVRTTGAADSTQTIGGWSLDLVDYIQPAHPPQVLTPRLCDTKHATIVGTEGHESIRGTSGNDVILGLGGNDKIAGRGGRDRICGGTGHDRLNAGYGRDRLLGGAGNDVLTGFAGGDSLDGGSGRDRCTDESGPRGDRGGPLDEGRNVFLSCEF
jgi:hypothetical protein